MLIYYSGYVATYGRRFGDEEREVVYRTVLHLSDVELPSDRARIPRTVAEMRAYYDEVAATELADNEFLRWAAATFDALPVPTLVGPRWAQRAIAPLWRILTPALGRPARTCAEAAAHPRMRDLLGVRWNRRRALEFRLWTALLRAGRRALPAWLLLDPLAHNRYRYERLRERYQRPQLTSFAPVD